jgi:hypothetical protein
MCGAFKVAVVAVLAGTVLAGTDQQPCGFAKPNVFADGEAIAFLPGHEVQGGEWWVEVYFEPAESSTFLDWSFTRGQRTDPIDKITCGLQNGGVSGDSNNGLMQSRGRNQYFRGSLQVVLIGPVRDGVAATPVARCRNGQGSIDNCEVKFVGINYIDCTNCPVGFKARKCNPESGGSTLCTKCDIFNTPTAGVYCTGYKPAYTTRIISNDAINVPGIVAAGTKNPEVTIPERGPDLLQCPERFTCIGGQLIQCVSDTFALFCPAGTDVGLPLCPGGFFCPDVAQKKLCPPGTQCLDGQFKPLPCNASGGFQPEAGKVFCISNPPGSHSPTGIKPEPCPAGFRCPEGKAVPCNPGTFSRAGATVCSACPAGTFSDQVGLDGNSECKPCAIGKFQPNPGQKSCTDCPQSAVAPSAGSTICEACNASGGVATDSLLPPMIKVNGITSTCICRFGFSGPTCSRPDAVINEGGVGAPTNASLSSTSGGGGIVAPLIGGAAAIAVVGIAVVLLMRRRSAPQVESRLANRLYP